MLESSEDQDDIANPKEAEFMNGTGPLAVVKDSRYRVPDGFESFNAEGVNSARLRLVSLSLLIKEAPKQR